MRLYRIALAATVLWLGTSAPAHATTVLASSDLYSANEHFGVCFIFNGSTQDVNLPIGAVQFKAGISQVDVAPIGGQYDTCNGKTLAAERGCLVWVEYVPGAGLTCKVTLPVTATVAKSFRGSFMLEDGSHNSLTRDDLR